MPAYDNPLKASQVTLRLNYEAYQENKEVIDNMLDLMGTPLDGYTFKELKLTIPLDVSAMYAANVERRLGRLEQRYCFG